MKSEEIFDKATRPYGGRLTYRNKQIDALVQLCNSLLIPYSKDDRLLKPFPSVIFDFVENKSFNAFALKAENNYIIGINEAVILITNDLFNRMLSRNDILRNIGDPSKEENTDLIFDYYNNIDEMVSMGHKGNYQFKSPKDLVRRRYANHLTNLAITFIFEHELSHIIFGHLDYLIETYNNRRLAEFSDNLISQDNLDMQTLEMDADCTSLARCCNLAKHILDKPSRIHSDYVGFYQDFYSAFSDINFAITNMLLLFGDRDFSNTKLGKTSHPDPRIRQLMITATFDSIVKKWDLDIDYEKMKNHLIAGVIESNKAYELLTGKKVIKEVFKPEYYAKHPLSQAVLTNWKEKIRDKLEPHTFKPLAE